MQNEIINEDKLLDSNGNLKHIGYSKRMLLKYDRNEIAVRKTRIKENRHIFAMRKHDPLE